MPETQAALRKLGVELPAGAGYRFCGIRFVQDSMRVSADFPEGRGIGIRRTLLHQLLIQEAGKCGVQLLWKTPVARIAADGVELAGGRMRSRWIIGADGGGSRVRRWLGLNIRERYSHRMASRRHYRMRPWTEYMEIYWGPRAQAYVTPISREEVCIVVLGETAEDADFERALDTLPQLRERLAGGGVVQPRAWRNYGDALPGPSVSRKCGVGGRRFGRRRRDYRRRIANCISSGVRARGGNGVRRSSYV